MGAGIVRKTGEKRAWEGIPKGIHPSLRCRSWILHPVSIICLCVWNSEWSNPKWSYWLSSICLRFHLLCPNYSNELLSNTLGLSCGGVYYAVQGGSTFDSGWWNRNLWPCIQMKVTEQFLPVHVPVVLPIMLSPRLSVFLLPLPSPLTPA